MNLFNYLSARRRLVEINKTIEAMGGDDEASPMLLAQRDITSDEVTYFYYESISSVIYTLIGSIVLIMAYGVYEKI